MITVAGTASERCWVAGLGEGVSAVDTVGFFAVGLFLLGEGGGQIPILGAVGGDQAGADFVSGREKVEEFHRVSFV